MTRRRARIDLDQRRIADCFRRNGIQKLSLFGSVLRPGFRPESDVDVLVEFQPGRTPVWEFVDMEEELSAILGRKADLNTPGSLSRYFRDAVLLQAEVVYVAP